jgi:hypothetical protein
VGADETQRLVRPLVLPTAMLPCATPPPQQARWLARLQPPLPHTPLGARSLPAARQLRVGAAPGRIALGGHRRELARCNQQVRARRPRGAQCPVERATPAVLWCRAAHGPGRRVGCCCVVGMGEILSFQWICFVWEEFCVCFRGRFIYQIRSKHHRPTSLVFHPNLWGLLFNRVFSSQRFFSL